MSVLLFKLLAIIFLINGIAFYFMIAVYLNNDTKRNERIFYGLFIGVVVLFCVLMVLGKMVS
jgi:hypothetical protein